MGKKRAAFKNVLSLFSSSRVQIKLQNVDEQRDRRNEIGGVLNSESRMKRRKISEVTSKTLPRLTSISVREREREQSRFMDPCLPCVLLIAN